MPTTTVTTRTTGVAVHTISFRGLAGAIFTLLAFSAILYVIGFATTAWSIYSSISGEKHVGLWEFCTCGKHNGTQDWFRGVQAMIVIGLIGLLVALLLACLYLCVHTISKNATILALTIVCFLTVVFMTIGFIIYGVKGRDAYGGVSWSFGVCVVSAALCLVAGILSIIQMKQSGVRV